MRNLPTKQDYIDFNNEFSEGLKSISPKSCYYNYGSTKDGNAVYGRSDIDGGIILGSGVVTPKNEIHKISQLLKECLDGRPIPIQLNLLDKQSINEGQFMDYPPSYIDFFQSGDVNVLAGPDYISYFNSIDPKNQDLSNLANNFRKMRNTALFWEIYKENPATFHDSSRRGFQSSLDSLLKLPKNLSLIKNGKTNFKKSCALELARDLFPNLNHSIIQEVLQIYENPQEWARIIDDTDIGILRDFHDQILTHYESMVKTHIESN